MNLLLGITTYNRVRFLKTTLETFLATKSDHNWTIVIADDGSDDGSIEYIQSTLCEEDYTLIRSNRRGVHHQTNQILRHASTINFDYGFKIDDDLIFKQKEWDIKYIEAIKETGY